MWTQNQIPTVPQTQRQLRNCPLCEEQIDHLSFLLPNAVIRAGAQRRSCVDKRNHVRRRRKNE